MCKIGVRLEAVTLVIWSEVNLHNGTITHAMVMI
jgi:hypothetical protein